MFDNEETLTSGYFEGLAPPDIAPEDLVEELASVMAHRHRLDSRVAELIHQIDECEAYKRDGYSSMTAMLKHRMSLYGGEASQLVHRGNWLEEAPLVALAHARGALSGAQVDLLLYVCGFAPDAFAEAEGALVEAAMDIPLVADLKRHLDYWLSENAPEEQDRERHTIREFRSVTLRHEGELVRIHGWLDPEAGERLRAALDPGPPMSGDARSAGARRADLLVDIVSGASNRPELIVHVDFERLAGRTSGISETDTGSFLTVDAIRRLACECSFTRVVFGPDSQPLDVGRTKRLVTPAMRRAVMARDRHCVFPGCDRPARWCDVHHLHSWLNGGETEICNLCLLCRHHHTLVHEAGWTIRGKPGSLRFFRFDGSEVPSDPKPALPRKSHWIDFNPREKPDPSTLDIFDRVHTLPRFQAT
jgi:hypothetical protein